MFQTDSKWERSDSAIEVIRSLTGRPDLRQYPIVEVAPGTLVFQVEILFRDGGAEEGLGTRYFCAGVEAVLNFLDFDKIADIRVNLLKKKARGSDYDFHVVKEIRKAACGNETKIFCILEDGTLYPKNRSIKNLNETVLLLKSRVS